MTSPLDWPASVTPGQTISDTWGNQVVAGIRMQPAFVRGYKPGMHVGIGDNRLDLTGAGGLVNPNGILFAQGVYVQSAWAGLWSVHATWTFPPPNGDGDVIVWFANVSTHYAKRSAKLGSATFYTGTSNELSTSTIIPVTPGETIIEFHVQAGVNTQTVNVDFAACWIGPV
jgi:hypothetical protein